MKAKQGTKNKQMLQWQVPARSAQWQHDTGSATLAELARKSTTSQCKQKAQAAERSRAARQCTHLTNNYNDPPPRLD